MTTSSQWIEIDAADGKFGAYLALPHTGKGPGIILIQEIFGVNAHIRAVADQYAADGYVVLAPDIFWRAQPRVELGYAGEDWDKAVKLMQQTDFDKAVGDIALCGKTLRALPQLDGKVAIIGYCMGGMLAYNAAAKGLVDAAIAYYGGGIQNQLEKAASVKVPFQMHFGELDTHIPLAEVQKIGEKFTDNDNVEIHVYPLAEHGFNCSHRESYQQRAAALAHGNSLVFLGENL
ncbi:dienelactone hydrolase family protein [Herbaspirillum sp. RTI4]|uniref:dienelactone hydrolase family protein n=1 Tax=Herbaspirillum sp. RTI4 TaxID=3048640 RepID=UPI002AB51079|nr:dienelactone hydrolase family protein [Herbaspirillum sp. RTI4]MDY7579331.1 dienelactone hydrolase family protein [Herbaspirillum sp. RTI4]MEA9980245.1 dienelactone hydrolase family protein [Herbaspirillum sp. RTI4]